MGVSHLPDIRTYPKGICPVCPGVLGDAKPDTSGHVRVMSALSGSEVGD